MNQIIKNLDRFLNGFDKWHLDGALNISLLKGEYIGLHKDVDLLVERVDLESFVEFLQERDYGLFMSQAQEEGGVRKDIMHRVGYIGAVS